jgi:hypothetical protein
LYHITAAVASFRYYQEAVACAFVWSSFTV